MRIVQVLLVVAALVGWRNCLGQTAIQQPHNSQDLSGSWTLDETAAKSDKRSRSARVITALEISHRAPELKIRQTIKENQAESTEEVLFYTDGRGEVNLLPPFAKGAAKEKVESHSKWDKGRLVIKYSLVWRIAGDKMYFDVEETWQLANNGNALVHTQQLGNPQSAFHKSTVLPQVMEKTTSVYNRKP